LAVILAILVIFVALVTHNGMVQ